MVILSCSTRRDIREAATGGATDRELDGELAAIETTEHDFGVVLARGQTLRHMFRVRNPTRHELRLVDVEALSPCCSSLVARRRSVAPGEMVELTAEYRAAPASGERRVLFRVTTDDSAKSEYVFALRARLISAIECVTLPGGETQLGLGRAGRQRFRVTARRLDGEASAAPESVIASPPVKAYFSTMSDREESGEGMWEESREFEVEIPGGELVGSHYSTVAIRWPDGRELVQPVAWTVRPRISVSPSTLVLRPNGESIERVVSLRSDAAEFRIIAVESEGGLLAVRPSWEPGRSKRHEVRLWTDGREWREGVGGVRIRTDDPFAPEVVIRVIGGGGMERRVAHGAGGK